jgi:transcriptional regulator with XRE-family HTH domain
MYNNLQIQIKTRMKNMNLSAAALERKANLKIHAVRNILLGKSKKPSGETLQAIADALECSVKDLLSSSENANLSFNGDKITSKALNIALFLKSTDMALKLFTKKNFKPTLDLAIFLIKEIYLYSSKNNMENADENFANYLIDREK